MRAFASGRLHILAPRAGQRGESSLDTLSNVCKLLLTLVSYAPKREGK